jgi:hypothetical protein
MPQTAGDLISNESPFSSPASSTSRRSLKNTIWHGICLLSLFGCVLTSVAWYRSFPGSTMSDELELVCYFGCAVHSINERLYVSAFREPDWQSNGYPVRIRSDHGWSAGALSLIVMREFGDDSGMFGAAYASFVNENIRVPCTKILKYPGTMHLTTGTAVFMAGLGTIWRVWVPCT